MTAGHDGADGELRAVALAGRRGGKSRRQIAIDLFGAAQTDSEWTPDGRMRAAAGAPRAGRGRAVLRHSVGLRRAGRRRVTADRSVAEAAEDTPAWRVLHGLRVYRGNGTRTETPVRINETGAEYRTHALLAALRFEF